MPFALCSSKVSHEDKNKIAAAVRISGITDKYSDENVFITKSTSLADLVDEKSRFLFEDAKVCKPTWLQLPPAEWEDDDESLKFKGTVMGLTCPDQRNDMGSSTYRRLHNSVSLDDTQLQYLLQLVEYSSG